MIPTRKLKNGVASYVVELRETRITLREVKASSRRRAEIMDPEEVAKLPVKRELTHCKDIRKARLA